MFTLLHASSRLPFKKGRLAVTKTPLWFLHFQTYPSFWLNVKLLWKMSPPFVFCVDLERKTRTGGTLFFRFTEHNNHILLGILNRKPPSSRRQCVGWMTAAFLSQTTVAFPSGSREQPAVISERRNNKRVHAD